VIPKPLNENVIYLRARPLQNSHVPRLTCALANKDSRDDANCIMCIRRFPIEGNLYH
jgi:hypothetical protein